MEPENTPKVIELKEFVEEAISQIVDGITAAQKRVETSGAIVSPRKSNSKNNVEIEGKLYSVQNIEFEVSLANMSGEGGKVGFGVTFGAWGFGSNTKIEGQAKSATNINQQINIWKIKTKQSLLSGNSSGKYCEKTAPKSKKLLY